MRLDDADWVQTAVLVLGAYRHVATRRQAAKLESPEFEADALARSSRHQASTLTMPAPPFPPSVVADRHAHLADICLHLPETTEVPGPHPGYHVTGKAFAWLQVNHHGDRRLALVCKAPPGVQGALVDLDPARYFLPQYMARGGWIGLRLEEHADWGEVRALVEQSYRLIAPRRLTARWDARPAPRA